MNIMALVNALPGAAAQGLIWAIMAIGVYITYRVLDIADLTVDGTLCTGGAVCVVCMMNGCNVWVAILAATCAGLLAGFVTGIFHTFMGIQAILAGILTQLALWSVNLKIMGKANQAINVDKYDLIVSLRYIKGVPLYQNTIFVVAVIIAVLIAVLYWFFGTELGCGIRATGCNAAMARAQGINTNRNKVLGLMISNGLVALSGALLAQYQGNSDINMGRGAPERPTRPLEIIKPRTFMRLVEMPWARAMCSLLPVARMAQPSWVPKNQYSSATMAMTKMPLTKMAAGTLALESSSWYWVRLTVRLLLPPMMCILIE